MKLFNINYLLRYRISIVFYAIMQFLILLNGKYDIRDILLFNFIYLGGVFLDSSFYCSYHDNWYSVSLFILVYLLFLSGLYYFLKKKKKYKNNMLKSIINKIVFLYTVVNVFVLLQYKG